MTETNDARLIDLPTLQTWQKDWIFPEDAQVQQVALQKRRDLLEHSGYERKAAFSRAIQHVRQGRAALIEKYAFPYTDQLGLDSSVGSTPHLQRLLSLAIEKGANERPDPQRWFESLSLFDQAVSVALIEQADPSELVGQHLEQFIDLLKELFAPGFVVKDLYIYHDPKSHFEVHRGNVGIGHHLSRPGLIRTKVSLKCRHLWQSSNDFTFIAERIKDPYSAWLKIQRQLNVSTKKRPYVVEDRSGLLLVAQKEDVLDIAELISMLIVERGGMIVEDLEANFDQDQPNDKANTASSKNYKVAKMLIRWKGRLVELQFVTLHDYFSSKVALSEVNHDLYKLRQYLRTIFPLLFPKDLYGVDWEMPHIRHQLFLCKTSHLSWRVDGKRQKSS